jgi:hypothetical protein
LNEFAPPRQLRRYAVSLIWLKLGIESMKEWQNVAMSILPELHSEITAADNPMALWFEIVYAFDEAYNEPRNEDFIERVYRYAIGPSNNRKAKPPRNTCPRVWLFVSGNTSPHANLRATTCLAGSRLKT